jgi:hypothetical protein
MGRLFLLPEPGEVLHKTSYAIFSPFSLTGSLKPNAFNYEV